MAVPTGLAYDATNSRLFVSDLSNNRVLFYDVSTITDGKSAINVLGQPNYTSNTAATTQTGLNNPRGLIYDSTNARLYVTDTNNNRIMIFDAFAR